MTSINAPQNARSAAVRTLPRVKNVRINLRRRTSFADDASSVPDSKSSSPHRRSFDPPISKPHPAQALGAEDARAREADPQVDGAPEVALPQDRNPRHLLERTPAPEDAPSPAPGATRPTGHDPRPPPAVKASPL
ncbi:hypothetical protein HPB49_013355 [Dermacentor silvarum]|uniref:Uncharacterized protein n=1 Tax=Dermacentor silvarum TaxID=543639 RepID=A0ACB8CXQ1_DERSI|nr:hypothetical protein HPB49_013355 [Dermacentor silvarum]